MGPLSETAIKRLLFFPSVLAGVYIGRKLYNVQMEQHAMAMEAIKRFTQEMQNWETKSKSRRANTVCRDAAGSKDGI